SGTPDITLSELLDLSAVYKRAMSKADASTKQTIANLLINRVKLYPTKAVVEGIIPLDTDALVPSKHATPLRWPAHQGDLRKKCLRGSFSGVAGGLGLVPIPAQEGTSSIWLSCSEALRKM